MRKISNEEVFIENSTFARHNIKKRIIENKLITYECEECKNIGTHNEKKLSLQLDHINGISDDNRISNLRFLCPNCHSQTNTYAGKGSTGKRKYFNKMTIKHEEKYHDRKLKEDKKLWDTLKTDSDNDIKFGDWGWKTRLCKKIGIKSQKVTPWLNRVDPEFLSNYE